MSIYTKTNPYNAHLAERHLLNKPGSTKETYHLVLGLQTDDLPFKVGDSIGIFPENDQMTVEALVHRLEGESCREFLLQKANICKCTSAILRLLQERGGGDALSALLEGQTQAIRIPSNAPSDRHPSKLFPMLTLQPRNFASGLLPLMPRFYSIASSPKMFPQEIHLTVASLSYPTIHGERRGVGSQFLCHYANTSTPIPIYVQPSNGFTLPADPDASMILIGPGTGVAPFRAFLQERMALQHAGRNWLFFGERKPSPMIFITKIIGLSWKNKNG